MASFGVVNEVVPFEQLWDRAFEVCQEIAKIPAESMAIMKTNIRKIYDLRGLHNTMDYTAEMFNLNRTRMQMNEMKSFSADISSGGLKAALDSRYK